MKENVSLAPLTTFGIGGMARYFVEANTEEEIITAIEFARDRSLPLFILGGGSNVLISDNGFDGLVLAVRILGIATSKTSDGTLVVTVGSGVMWDDFVVWSIENGFAGLECMSGVPGTVGGAVVANLGCYGAQCSDTFVSAEVVDTQRPLGRSDIEGIADKVQVVRKNACDFSYHDSMFGREPGRYVVVRATFALPTDSSSTPSYRDSRFDLAGLAEKLGHKPTGREVRDAVLNIREEKGSLIMKDRVSYKCAGSFFHMPFVSSHKYAEILRQAQRIDAKKEEILRPWAWKQSDGSYKIAPGFLLEYTEFQKGYVRGATGISPRHTLSIINIGSARASEIANLARDMQNAVKKIFGIQLESEVEYVGDIR